jgi:hypothetical protein
MSTVIQEYDERQGIRDWLKDSYQKCESCPNGFGILKFLTGKVSLHLQVRQ